MIRRLFSLIVAAYLLGVIVCAAKNFAYTDVEATEENIAAVTEAIEKKWMQAKTKTTFEPKGSVSLKECVVAIGTVYMTEKNKPQWPSSISGAKKEDADWVYMEWAYRSGLLDDWIRERGGIKRDAKKKIILKDSESVTHKDFVHFLRKAQTPVPYNDNLCITVKGIPKGAYYEQSAGWAIEQKIAPWIQKNQFYSDSNVTRIEMAISLYRLTSKEQAKPTSS